MSRDLSIFENGNGGELLLLNNDLNLNQALLQQVYLAFFGGNVEANTTGVELSTEQRFDWWGNSLFFRNTQPKQFNSNLERVLDSVVLNTSGRIDIERAAQEDLNFLNSIANVSINVVILSEDRVSINTRLQRPPSIQDVELQFIWDNAIRELIIQREI